MPPTMAGGKICYIEMPATDIARSAEFYKSVFGWNIRKRGDGATAFDDGVGEVSGAWVLGRPSSAKPGLWARTRPRSPPASPTPRATFSGCTRSLVSDLSSLQMPVLSTQ